nr:hypothetical protein [Tanacetum cinerariifolium]
MASRYRKTGSRVCMELGIGIVMVLSCTYQYSMPQHEPCPQGSLQGSLLCISGQVTSKIRSKQFELKRSKE